jgi:hypothetical protein
MSFQMLSSLAIVASLAAGLSPSPHSLSAEERAPVQDSWHLHQNERAWLQPFDPTLLTPRLLTQWEHQDLNDGNSNGKVFANIREAFLLSKSLAFGLQAEIPLNWAETAGQNFSGLGDLESRIGIVHRVSPSLRWGLGMNARFDTATESALGDGVFELRPLAALRWDATKSLNLGLQPEYTFTPSPKDGRNVESFQLKLPVTFKLNSRLSALVSYQPKWNLANDDARSDRLEVNANVLLGLHKRYALTVGVEAPLSHDSLDWKGYVGLQWFFR